MTLRCALWDYGVGNLHSLAKALVAAGARADVTTNAETLDAADVVVLPGVGAFGHVLESLESVRDLLAERHAAGRPLLGVCIGLQAMHDASEESRDSVGLGLLPGTVARLPATAGKIPHMGWNSLDARVAGTGAAETDAADAIIGPVAGQHVYYVHSYAAPVANTTTATTTYGATFAAATQAGRDGMTVGFQFHPEKSSDVGAGILRRTLAHFAEAT
jgi:glutamine amidotransferase